MTNNPFKDFSGIITSYQDSSIGDGNFSQPSNKNTFRCLQCQRQISLSQYSPYCSSHCMNGHDKGIKTDHKGSEKNTMLGFSEVFIQ